MAITRTQIAKQLLANGGRTGFQGGGRDAATESFAQSLGGQSFADKVGSQFGFQGDDRGDRRSAAEVRSQIASRTQEQKNEIARKEKERLAAIEAAEKARAKASLSPADKFRILTLKNQIDQSRGLKPTIGGFASIGNVFNPSMVDSMYRTDEEDEYQDLFEGVDFGISGPNLEREDIIKDAITKGENTGDITQKETEDAFYSGKIYSLDKDGNIVSKPKPRPDLTGDRDGRQDPCKGPNPPAYCFVGIRSAEAATPVEEEDEIINYRLMAGGGMADKTVGGIMDLESARQMYGLGKLVKKVTRGIKKIAKSPIGKAALAFGTYKLGGGFLKDKGGISGIFDLIKANPYKSIFGLSALSGLMTKEEEEEKLNQGADLSATPRFIMDNPQLFQTYRTMAEGGSTEEKEPVAKKVMPLLDMDGQEKDYRETGGFVDMGRMEKADDVPARLSKNEFVFTADAVRNAGDGSVDKGAEVMYNMMKNLESGGEVSEESQGLEGAREMFQTSQRLEEVL